MHIDDVVGAGFHVGIEEIPKPEPTVQPFLSIKPNPISRATAKIAFGVKQSDNLSIAVFDAAGRFVKKLACGKFEPGKYSVKWKTYDDAGKNAINGVYPIVYRYSNQKLTKKIIVNE